MNYNVVIFKLYFMKKIIVVIALFVFIFSACSKDSNDDLDQLKKENQELREALAANARIESVEFTDTEMILTYSNGLKVTTSIPDVLKGEDGATPYIGENGHWWIGEKDSGISAQGANGEKGATPKIGDNGHWWIGDEDTGVVAKGADGVDGVGIKSMSYDPETGMLVIVLTNGNESKFKISNQEGDLSAVLMDDINGAYLVTKISMGDIPYAQIEYNAENQVTKITTSTANGYTILKNMEIEKEYANGKPSKIITRRYATEKTVKYSDEYLEQYIDHGYVVLEEYKGDGFVESNTDGSYDYYSYQGGNDGLFFYDKFWANVGSRLDNEMIANGDGTRKIYKYYSSITIEGEEYYYYKVYDRCIISPENRTTSLKIGDDVFEIFDGIEDAYNLKMEGHFIHYTFSPLRYIRTIEGSYEVGDVMYETFSSLTYSNDGKIEKIYASTEEGVDATEYYQNNYNAEGLLETSERFVKENDSWIKDPVYNQYQYNTDNLVANIVEIDGDGSEKVISKVDYDEQGNPTEIFRYQGEFIDRRFVVDPATGLGRYIDDVVAEAGLYSVAKLEYDYTMKNFMGHSLEALFPELYGFTFNNAIKGAAVSNTGNYGVASYKCFNDGGYPEVIDFLGGGTDEGSYQGELTIEYMKIAD